MLRADPIDFSPALLRIQEKPPAPLAGWMLRLLIGLLAGVALWAVFGRLDIVAVADGKLVPSSYLKIVQPAEQGIVKEILVREGEKVAEGQVLIRMDAALAQADLRSLAADVQTRGLALRRIDAQLAGRPNAPGSVMQGSATPGLVAPDAVAPGTATPGSATPRPSAAGAQTSQPFARQPGDSPAHYAQALAQYEANVRAYENALAQERSLLHKARHDLAAAESTKAKLEQVLPHYVEQERAFAKLQKDGFAGRVMATDKARERIEKEQDLRTQEFVIRSSRAVIAQSEAKIAQITADYRRALQAERVETAMQLERASQELAKHEHRRGLLELRAPQAGIVKDLATYTAGTVVAPGTILMTLVPEGDKLVAEVWVSNQDVGFVRMGQDVKVKLAAFQFQKYGMVDGKVLHINADATEAPSPNTRSDALAGRDRPMGPLAFRALVELGAQELRTDAARYALAPGMQVSSEIHLGTRSILEYVLSPVQKAWHEAARER
jgi:HlyD family secretion protein